MKIERMSADGLTRETWLFRWEPVDAGRWVCTFYDRAVRTKKTHKTWRLAETSDMECARYRWGFAAMEGLKGLASAPIDDALVAEVRRRAAEAQVVGRRS